MLFSGARIGFGVAGEYISAGANVKVEPDENLPPIASTQSHIGKALQIAPCIELGITVASYYYLGLQASWRPSSIKNKLKAPVTLARYFTHEFKIDEYADLLLKSGYKITPRAMIYGLIGPTFAKWSYTTDHMNTIRLIDRFRINRKSLGVGIGLGFEYIFRKKYALSFDYTYHFHRSVSDTSRITVPLGGGNFYSGNLTRRVQPSYGVLAARFTVFFNL